MLSSNIRVATQRRQHLYGASAAAAAVLLMNDVPARAILSGLPTATSGQARFETVPLGSDDQTPKFSHTADGKLNWELNSIGSGGFGGWPDLGAPTIVSGVGPGALPLSSAQAPTSTYGGGAMALSVVSITGAPSVGLGLTGTVSDAGPNGMASVTTGLASGTWTNSLDQPPSNPLDMMVIMSQIVIVPAGGLMEMSLAGNTGNVTGGGSGSDLTDFHIVAGLDNSGNRTNICYGGTTGVMGLSGFTVTQIAPTTYWVRGFFHFGQTAFDGESIELNANETLAMDPAIGSFVRPGPIPIGDVPVASGGAGVYASEAPGFSTEWTNTAGSSDFNNPANFSSGSPAATGEAFLADIGASTPGGTTISTSGSHNLHLITIANSTGNYTIGLSPHQGSFNFGSNGGIEVYSGGPTVNNCDISSSGQLNFRVADPTTTLKQYGGVSSPIIHIDGLGTLQFESSFVSLGFLQANTGTTEFVAGLTTSASFQIGTGALVQLDAPSMLNSPGATINIAQNGTLALTGSTTVAASVTNAGLIHLSGSPPNFFAGTVSNSGSITIDAGATGGFGGPISGSGTFVNDGNLFFNATASCGSITGAGTTTVAPHASLTQGGATFTQGGGLVNNGTVQIDGSGTVGPISGTGTITLGNGSSANTLHLVSGSGASSQNALIISTGSTLDIANNHMFINYGGGPDPIASIAAWIASGYAGGAWNGTGIMSTNAQTNGGSYGIGYADAADPGNPANLSSGQIEIMYTLLGDANLDGAVNGSDFAILATNFNKAVTGWDQGDFNYDGAANGADFAFLAANFNKGASQSANVAALDSFAAANGLMADVPEPTFGGLILLAGLGSLARRKRARIVRN